MAAGHASAPRPQLVSMYRFFMLFVALMTTLPGVVCAHATPVSMSPDSGENVRTLTEVSIRFSEHLERGSSRIKVTNEIQESVTEGSAYVSEDAYTLLVPVTTTSGVHVVSWSVVSRDDGHFTKGSFAFSVGSSTVSSASDAQIVKIATYPEVWAMFLEFFGNSVLLGMLALCFLFLRRSDSGVAEEVCKYSRHVLVLGVGASCIGLSGGLAQLCVKTRELSLLHEIPLRDAFPLYVDTSAGESLLIRLSVFILCAIIVVVFRDRFLRKLNVVHFVLLSLLLVFAIARAFISHASANPFYPELSILINVFHLLEKDVWFGISLLAGVLLMTRLRQHLSAWLPDILRFLSANLAILSLTAGYIIWLHLQSFRSIVATEWGESCILLLSSAGVLVTLHAYHVIALKKYPSVFVRLIPYTLAAEMVAAAFVVFFTSLVIITSPPSHAAHAETLRAVDRGVAIELARAPYEDASMLLTVKSLQMPIVIIGSSDGGLLVDLTQRFEGGYVFPRALLNRETKVRVIAPNDSGYDARATFTVSPETFALPPGHGRNFDFFTIAMIALSISGAAGAVYLLHFGAPSTALVCVRAPRGAALIGGGIALVGIVLIQGAAGLIFNNEFKALCLSDQNSWHLMAPQKAGSQVSEMASEGCMLASGTYHFADAREYAYLRALPQAEVHMETAPSTVVAGVPVTVTFALKEKDGTPAQLGIEHERILHIIFIGKDKDYFAHMHPEEARENAEGRFSVNHTFPKAGSYVVAVDYLHGITHESRQFTIDVGGESMQSDTISKYPSPARFGEYDVAFKYVAPIVGEIALLQYTIRKEGVPVVDLAPYLGAAMHLAIIKNDDAHFIHTHGEVHPEGYVAPSRVGHAHAPPPARFGPRIEAHVVFPERGDYTVFSEFKDAAGNVIVTRFTARVEME